MRVRFRTIVLAAAALLVLGAGTAMAVIWLGVYDVSAQNQHTGPVYRLLDYALRRSVAARTETLRAPEDLEHPQRVRDGLSLYREHCLQCHGAPGVAPAPLAFGLLPAPANLLSAGRTWRAPEVFWIVKHGIKMSGMPAWTTRLSDEEIWDVVAFVRAMPRLAPAEYRSLARTVPPPAGESGAAALRPGDAAAGRLAAARYLCATCHAIPGLVGAEHRVGPPLAGSGTRSFIAGVLPNTRENMVRFLRDPQAVDPLSAMPALGVTEQDARDIAAFLATLDKPGGK